MDFRSLVRAATLSADALIDAMEAGDFVACEGLEPEDVAFDPDTATLTVAVAAKAGAARTIRFIVSKRDFSETPSPTELWKEYNNVFIDTQRSRAYDTAQEWGRCGRIFPLILPHHPFNLSTLQPFTPPCPS